MSEIFDSTPHPFKVTQGHWNRYGSIGYLKSPFTVYLGNGRTMVTTELL